MSPDDEDKYQLQGCNNKRSTEDLTSVASIQPDGWATFALDRSELFFDYRVSKFKRYYSTGINDAPHEEKSM